MKKFWRKFPDYLEENLKLLPEKNSMKFFFTAMFISEICGFMKQNGKWQISGLFDFADSLKGSSEYDFLAVGL